MENSSPGRVLLNSGATSACRRIEFRTGSWRTMLMTSNGTMRGRRWARSCSNSATSWCDAMDSDTSSNSRKRSRSRSTASHCPGNCAKDRLSSDSPQCASRKTLRGTNSFVKLQFLVNFERPQPSLRDCHHVNINGFRRFRLLARCVHRLERD